MVVKQGINMKKLALAVSTAVISSALFASGAWAQSAKFAASYDIDLVEVDTGLIQDDDPAVLETGAEVDLATIHVASQKDLLIGVSAQINIYTQTEARGKEGTGSTAIAEGSVGVTVRLAPTGTVDVCLNGSGDEAAPGQVVFASRLQQLTVESDALEEVRVNLILDTSGAHHFNFLGIDLAQGTYDVVACYDLSAFADVLDGDGSAQAKVGLSKRVVAVQEVRAAKGGIIDESGDTGL